MSNEMLVWELRRGDEILGTLTSVGWGRPPWIDCHFAGKRKPHHTPYFALFREYTHVRMLLGGYNIWRAPELIPPDFSSIEERDVLEKRRQELLQTIHSLQFTLVPASPSTHPGKLTDIYAHGRHVMIVANFGDAPINYWW